MPTAVSPLSAKPRALEDARELIAQGSDDLGELGENQHFFLAAGDGRGDLGKPQELAAFLALPARGAAEAVRSVIADLFQAHQRREHQTAPSHVIARLFELLLEGLHRLLIERRLFAAECSNRP